MTTQHPDHANVPYWHRNALIRTHSEAYECFLSFSEYGCDEHMWDWEGKLVDESVLERLLSEHELFFQDHPLGQDKFLTFRLPNPKVETEFRLGRALMNILLTSSLAQQLGLPASPIFEVVLPLTETADELIDIQNAYQEITTLKHPLYRLDKGVLKHLQIIPLFEQVSTLINSDEIIRKYLNLHQQTFGFLPPYLRPFMARSDPALNSGLVPIMLAVKIALARYKKLAVETGVAMYPIIGVGSLPFRGGLTPLNVAEFVHEYQGCHTVLIQSAFRYDYQKEEVVQGIRGLQKLLPGSQPQEIAAHEEKALVAIIPFFEAAYTETIEGIAPIINQAAAFIPRRRERMQHIGLFGYSREVGIVKLPRAIGFTAALYSLGVPPELIGTGRGLALTTEAGHLKLLEKFYLNLRKNLEQVGGFLNKENLLQLTKVDPAWLDVQKDVIAIEQYLGHQLQPISAEEKMHHKLTTQIYQQLQENKSVTELIEQAALVRKSLG